MPLAVPACGRSRTGVAKSLAAAGVRVSGPGKAAIARARSGAATRTERGRSRCPGRTVTCRRGRNRATVEASASSMETTTAAAVKPASTAPMEASTTAHMTTATTAAVLGKNGYGREGKQN